MPDNETLTAPELDVFYKEAQKRGIYTSAQESLASAWKTLATTVLPSVGVDMQKITVGELKEKLPGLLKAYGAKSDVKASTIQTYEAKGIRLLTDFITYNGAPDAKWYEWKQKNEKKSQQASAAASARFGGKKTVKDDSVKESNGVDDATLQKHTLKLPGGRAAELHVPTDLRANDIRAIESGFAALIAYLKTQIDAELMEDGD
jgi:hypothetical protein